MFTVGGFEYQLPSFACITYSIAKISRNNKRNDIPTENKRFEMDYWATTILMQNYIYWEN